MAFLFACFRHPFFRAIPEAGYIKLGTIRYGVKLAANSIDRFSMSSNGTTTTQQHNGDHRPQILLNVNEQANVESSVSSDGDANDLSDVSSTNACNQRGCCCINRPRNILPWTSNKPPNGLQSKAVTTTRSQGGIDVVNVTGTSN